MIEYVRNIKFPDCNLQQHAALMKIEDGGASVINGVGQLTIIIVKGEQGLICRLLRCSYETLERMRDKTEEQFGYSPQHCLPMYRMQSTFPHPNCPSENIIMHCSTLLEESPL